MALPAENPTIAEISPRETFLILNSISHLRLASDLHLLPA